MSNVTMVSAKDIDDWEWWECTGELRFIVPEGTTTQAPKPQQLWIERRGGRKEWRAVPRVVVPQSEFNAS